MNCAEVAAIGLHLVSMHFPDEYNDRNPGAFVRMDCGIQAGVYYNSEDRMTVYGAYLAETSDGPISLWGAAGLATGYRASPIVPTGMVGVRVGPFRLGYMPAIPKAGNPHLIHLAAEWRF